MNQFIQKTFAGMDKQVYLRHLLFGSLFLILPFYAMLNSDNPVRADQIAFFVVNTLLYPYSRFVYESLIDYILGKNVFFVNALLMLIVKLFTMLMCWGLALFIAPVGLAYLYYINSRENA